MNTSWATSSRKVIVRIQRRTAAEVLRGAALLSAGGRRRTAPAAAAARRQAAIKNWKRRATPSVCQIPTSCGRGFRSLPGGRLAPRGRVQEPLEAPHELSRLGGILGDHRV